jgi:AraC-like DNA-binding protein
MDVHIVPGVNAKDVAQAHKRDLNIQEEHKCKCMTYWVDEGRETIFCLIEAPEKDAVEKMHREAHGLIPHKIIEVNNSVVESFLGRIYDPADAEISDSGLKIFSDPSFRILLVTTITDPVLLQHKLGEEKTNELLATYNKIVRTNLALYDGREAEHEGSSFIISFPLAIKAVSCALAIQKDMNVEEDFGFRLALNSGEPVEESNTFFGDTIKLAMYMCSIGDNLQIAITSKVKDLISKDLLQNKKNKFLCLSIQDETLLKLLLAKLEENWSDADFDISDYGHQMAMSKSQLYRKTISLTTFSPNSLLKEFRLEKAKELLKKKRYSISQITFEAGFTSPSYFTKCFKKKYGLLPMEYLDILS